MCNTANNKLAVYYINICGFVGDFRTTQHRKKLGPNVPLRIRWVWKSLLYDYVDSVFV